MTTPAEIGQSFIQHYYKTFDTDRAAIAALYLEQSQLTFEGATFTGRANIAKKITELPFKTIQHVITTVDIQVTLQNSILVFVVGQLKTDDDPPHGFSQTFLLGQVGTSIFVANDCFRLQLHHQ
ncbi:nuclear transport factor 2-like [Apostichopus japonicus]|uniref:nuclear transport factor 2-like n=1 Tax=Stichopus japonicus TaxID=307972 RepID=UPI003AB8569C